VIWASISGGLTGRYYAAPVIESGRFMHKLSTLALDIDVKFLKYTIYQHKLASVIQWR
jgi:hypothetical protein